MFGIWVPFGYREGTGKGKTSVENLKPSPDELKRKA
jgi:hypothetical protein